MFNSTTLQVTMAMIIKEHLKNIISQLASNDKQ